MSIAYTGFQRESLEVIIERIVRQLLDAKPNLSITPDNPFYQLAKISASEILRTQILLEEAYKNMTIIGAAGVWLDNHGIESGIGRRKASFANGIIKMSGDANTIIPTETVFNTSDNKEYVSYESVSIQAYDSTLKSTSTGYDIPSPIYDATIDSIRTDPSDELTAMNPALWYISSDHITFRNPATDFTDPSAGTTCHYLQATVPTTEPSSNEIWIPTVAVDSVLNYQIFTDTAGVPTNIQTPTEGQVITDTGGDSYLYYNSTIWNVTTPTPTTVADRITTDSTLGAGEDGNYYYADANFIDQAGSPVYKDRVYIWDNTNTTLIDQSFNINGKTIDITTDQDYVYVNGWQEIPTATYTVDDLTTTIYGLTTTNTYMMNNTTEKWSFEQWMIYKYNTTSDQFEKSVPIEFNDITFSGDTYVYYNSAWSEYVDVSDGVTVYILYDTVSFNVNIRSSVVGTVGNTAAYTINECSDFASYTVTNVNPIVNGLDVEVDEEYRERQLKTRRGNFNAWSIKRRLLETQSIRLARVYQAYGTDRAEMKTGGIYDTTNYKNTYAGGTGGFTNHYGFTFYPSEGVATLKGITIHGAYKGDPDWLDIRLYKAVYVDDDTIDYTVFDDNYLRKVLLNPKELEEQPASSSIESPAQEIFVPFDYEKMENSSTYVVVIMGSTNDDANNYWHIFYGAKNLNDINNDWRSYAFEDSALAGTETSNDYPYMKTHHGINAYNISYVVNEGYTDSDVLDDIEVTIDTENGYGFQPAGVVRVSTAADPAYINLETSIVVDARYDSTLVSEQIQSDITLYCNNLDIGENITYSRIEYIILSNPGVVKAYDTHISLNGNDYLSTNESQDIVIRNNEYAKFNTATEGTWTVVPGTNLKGVTITVV